MTEIIDTLADVAADYDAVFCDVWGVLHNGLRPFDDAVAALTWFRDRGGTVLLLTNAPRPRATVQSQLDRIGVPREAWDTIATSGDSARAALFQGAVGTRVWHIGTPGDEDVFQPLHLIDDPVAIERVPLEQADGIVCTSPFDVHADPSSMRPQLLAAKTRGLPMLCANPDIVVDRGETREWCAGAIAALYAEMGGRALYFGKPHPPIYDLARMRLAEVGADPDGRILAIGDGISTDVAGAMGEGLDVLFVAGGLAATDTATMGGAAPDAALLRDYLARHELSPRYTIGLLR